jgi:putative oxidoreductase
MTSSAATRTVSAASDAAPSTSTLDIGLLLLRLVLGLTMAAHGAQKLFGWFGGRGVGGTGQFFTSVGYPAGKVMAVVAGSSEILGGLGIFLGLLTPLAGAAVVGVLANAIAVKWGGGFFAPQGVEFELFLATAAIALVVAGPGRYAVDRLVPVTRWYRPVHGLLALAFAAVTAGIVLMLRT